MIRRALLLAGLAAAVVPTSANAAVRLLGGTTKDSQPIVFGLNTASGNVDRVTVMFTAQCDSGKGYSFGHRLKRVSGEPTPGPGEYVMTFKRRSGGRFVANGMANESLPDESHAAIAITITGRISKGRVITGAIEADVKILKDAAQPPQDSCTYSRKSLRAKRTRGVLAGETSQSLPVVMTLDRRARTVKALNIGWNAECEPPGFIQIPDELVSFKIRNARFGDAFPYSITLADGTKRTFDYTLRGTATRRRASGTLKVVMTDQGGQADGTCTTPQITFKVA